MALSDKLAQLSQLRADGALSEEEYQNEKDRILSIAQMESAFPPSSSTRRTTVISVVLYSLGFGVAITVLSNVLKFAGAYFFGWFIPANTFIIDSLIGIPLFGYSASYLPFSLAQSLVALSVLVVGSVGVPAVAQRLGRSSAAIVIAMASGVVATVAVALISELAGYAGFTLEDGGILSVGAATILAFGLGLTFAFARVRR